jgi:hypothetical protein
MRTWPEKIEGEYQSWILCRELFDSRDFKYFARFLWACVEDPSGAPNEAEFRTRLARDRNLEPDEQGHPHPLVEKARDLFTDFPDLLVYAPNRFRKCLKRAFFKRYGYG